MTVTFSIWRQAIAHVKSDFENYEVSGLTDNMSFLEALDHLNEQLVRQNKGTIAYEYDCRERICGQSGVFINRKAHNLVNNITTCQLHMHSFKDGDTILVEPWRTSSFPAIKDLLVDRSSLDNIIKSAGFITAKTGTAPEVNAILINKKKLRINQWTLQLV